LLLSTTTIISYLVYFYLKWSRALNYWKSQNISGPKPLPIFGNILSRFLRPMSTVELEWYKKYGQIFGVYTGDKPALSVADPELIKQILVKDFHLFRNRRDNGSRHPIITKNLFAARDDHWKRVRAIASPTFSSGKMRKMYALIRECCLDFIKHIDNQLVDTTGAVDSGSGGQVELKKLMGNYTMDVIARCAFATKTNTYSQPDNEFTTRATKAFTTPIWRMLLLGALPSRLFQLTAARKLVIGADHSKFFIDVSRNLINQRKANQQLKYNDFLQLLMDVERPDNANVENREEMIGTDTSESHHVLETGQDELRAKRQALANDFMGEKKLTENEILAQCFVFFIAGYETTASTLAYCFYELALNPQLQDRLYEETQQVFDSDGNIDYEVLSRLPFTDSLLSETLRHYPPLLRLDREAMADVRLGGTGSHNSITIEKGLVAEIPVYAIHHDPGYYPDPFSFQPDRFMPENRSKLIPYTYLPFGAGPRNCVGMRFALLEAKLALAQLTRRFRFSRVPDTDVPVVFNRGRFLLQTNRLVVGIEKR
ncbi:cytochrome P450 3A11-like, partial [Oppia nitens]|uniref:cytochrome P450 3A11-like n=1 Tax=Oppia nitens TaxID=1686743 RepID=UPI0023DCBF7D